MNINFEVYAGDCLPISLELEDSGGSTFDLTGYDAEVKLIWNDGVDGFAALKSPVLGGVLGTITGTFTSAQTDLLPTGKNTKAHLVMTQPDNCLKTVSIGLVRVNR